MQVFYRLPEKHQKPILRKCNMYSMSLGNYFPAKYFQKSAQKKARDVISRA